MKHVPRLFVVPTHLPANVTQRTHLDGSLGGVVDGLTFLPEWAGVIAMNQLVRRIVFRKEPPYSDGDLAGRALGDRDFDRIRLWFQDTRGLVISKQTLVEAARVVAGWNAFHPVADYLRGLTWDGTPRLLTWLEDFCRVVPTSAAHEGVVRSVARKWMISCVARALEPGCKVDTMLILEGRQGIGKSTALRILAGEAFFCDSSLAIGSKEASQTIQGAWIYELPELDALLRRESSSVKAFLSRSSDRFCMPYGRAPETVPRSVVFAGTVNHGGYLRDKTGNRRFWIVRCEEALRTEALGEMRDVLWAEARHLYEQGETWHLDPEHEAAMRGEHEGRVEVDPWEERVETWVTLQADASFTMEEVLGSALGLGANRRTPRLMTQVARTLERLGYERRKRSVSPRGYYYARCPRVEPG